MQQLFPAVTLSPVPIALGSDITWSPGLSFTNNTTSKQPLAGAHSGCSPADRRHRRPDRRHPVTAFSFDTPDPLRVVQLGQLGAGRPTRWAPRPDSVGFRIPNPATPDPNDSRLGQADSPRETSRARSTGTPASTCPYLFRGSWKLQPVVGIANSTSGPFAIRNRNTNGNFVRQGKRFRFGVTGVARRCSASFPASARWPGSGTAFRRSSPGTTSRPPTIPEEFARAIALPGQPVELRSDADAARSACRSRRRSRASCSPQERRYHLGGRRRKIRLLSISTSGVSYDFEQAKKPGFTGWATQSVTNSILSDLLPGFNLSLTHDLWRGAVGSDTSKFEPFLQNVSASFAISANTFRSIGSIFGLGGKSRENQAARRTRSRVLRGRFGPAATAELVL